MTVWPYPIDWSATAAGLSATVAASVLGWTVYWSHRKSYRDALANIANHRVRWMEHVRDCVVEFTDVCYEYSEKRVTAREITKLNHKIMLLVGREENLPFLNAMNDLLEAAQNNSTDYTEKSSAFREEANSMLRREWEKVKHELKGLEG